MTRGRRSPSLVWGRAGPRGLTAPPSPRSPAPPALPRPPRAAPPLPCRTDPSPRSPAPGTPGDPCYSVPINFNSRLSAKMRGTRKEHLSRQGATTAYLTDFTPKHLSEKSFWNLISLGFEEGDGQSFP